MTKLIIDTNLWISFLISKKYDQLISLLDTGQIRIIFSQELLDELYSVARRKKFWNTISEKDLTGFLKAIEANLVMVEPQSKVRICRDPKDDFVINLGLDGNVDYLVSGDKDLLEIKADLPFRIIKFRQFLEEML
ncbi:MAG: putative toxin-antitoxin system toxin component, PIN family [Bacteroidota bacterium]